LRQVLLGPVTPRLLLDLGVLVGVIAASFWLVNRKIGRWSSFRPFARPVRCADEVFADFQTASPAHLTGLARTMTKTQDGLAGALRKERVKMGSRSTQSRISQSSMYAYAS